MKEISKIVQLYELLEASGRKAALATVVAVEGSSYRRQGAKMLISDDGRWEGSISGGCLEGDALRKARAVMASGTPMLVTYNTMGDGADSLGIGLGCNGIIHVFIEPIDVNKSGNPIHVLKEFLSTKEVRVIATVIESHHTAYTSGTRFELTDDRFLQVPLWLLDEMNQTLHSGKAHVQNILCPDGELSLFFERIDAGISLVICGAGNDAAPLASLATEMGWEVAITEDCVAHLQPKKFPASCQLLYSGSRDVVHKIKMSKRTAVVLLSHNYKYDLSVLESLLPLNLPYIGILGPAKRFTRMKEELEGRNVQLEETQLERIFAPAGLDIGAETPEEIALSIVSEIKAVFSGRSSGFLKDRTGPIHERNSETFTPSSTIQHVA